MVNGVDRIELQTVVPNAMADVSFSQQSIWNNSVTLHKENSIILAPSGSGKTSLISFVYGSRFDYSGNIHIGNKNSLDLSLREWTNHRTTNLSIIFQDLRLIPHLTVKENLLLKNKLTGHKSESEIQRMVELLGIGEKWNQSCGTLSYGQQQRVAIIRALLQPFDFLLADEPFSHLDDANIEKAKQLILQECDINKGVMIMFSLGADYGIRFTQKYHL